MYVGTTNGVAKFMQFLSNNAAIDRFISNFNNQNDTTLVAYIRSKCSSKHSFSDMILTAFDWERTAENYDYWCNLSKDWRLFVNKKMGNSNVKEKEEKITYNSIW